VLPLPPSVPAVLASLSLLELQKAISIANLAETLNSSPNLTVFAPSDAAFDQIPPPWKSYLFSGQDSATETLKSLLLLHVVQSNVVLYSSNVTSGILPTVSGYNINITISNGIVVIDGTSNVTDVDNLASNGVVHIINSVLAPPNFVVSPNDILDYVPQGGLFRNYTNNLNLSTYLEEAKIILVPQNYTLVSSSILDSIELLTSVLLAHVIIINEIPQIGNFSYNTSSPGLIVNIDLINGVVALYRDHEFLSSSHITEVQPTYPSGFVILIENALTIPVSESGLLLPLWAIIVIAVVGFIILLLIVVLIIFKLCPRKGYETV
jgi:hypothetical protein